MTDFPCTESISVCGFTVNNEQFMTSVLPDVEEKYPEKAQRTVDSIVPKHFSKPYNRNPLSSLCLFYAEKLILAFNP